jgi:DNA-binding PadR family transcriptional regulator
MEPKLLLLGLLREQDMHGYQLYEFIERDLSICTDLKKPTAYYLLNKMAQDGWVDEAQLQEGNRPPRKVYSLTERGEAEYQRMLGSNLSAYTPAYFSGDAGLAFLDSLERGQTIPLLQQRRAALLEALVALQEVPKHAGSLQYVIDHHIHHLKSELEWLDALLVELEQDLANDSQ